MEAKKEGPAAGTLEGMDTLMSGLCGWSVMRDDTKSALLKMPAHLKPAWIFVGVTAIGK